MTKLHSDGTEIFWDEINPEIHNKDPVLIAGNIIGISQIENYTSLLAWKCDNCSYDGSATIDESEKFEDFRTWKPYPDRCPHCNAEVKIIQNTKSEVRKVTLQEPLGDNPHLRSIQGFIFGKNVKIVQPSQDTHFKAVLRSIYQKGKKTYLPAFDIYKMKMQLQKQEKITDDDIELFNTLGIKDVVSCFCPKIKGNEDVKEGLLLCLAGGLSGDESGISNAFLIGDPATGKTEMLKYITEIVTKSDYTSGRSASAAGLVAGLDNMADGTRQVRFGPVVNCHNGVVTIDEMDKMIQPDQSALHECMSKHTYSLKKVGVNMTLPTYTIVIGAANPVGSGKWQEDRTIRENIKLADSLVSRFGLIFLMRDKPNRDMDREILRQMSKAKTDTIECKLDTQGMKKYLEYIKRFNPVLTEKSRIKLEDWYLDLRETEQLADSVAIDPRTFNDLINFTVASAKFRKSEETNVDDAKQAISIIDKSLHSLNMSTPGEKNKSTTMSAFLDKDSFTKMIFENEISRSSAIVKMSETKFYNTITAAKAISILHNKGFITEVSDGVYKWV